MTPSRLIEIFKEISEALDCVFFAGVTAEFLRTTVEAEESQGKTFVVIELRGLNIKDDFGTGNSKIRFTVHVIKRDVGDSVSQEADNLGPYDAIQTICIDCYNKWVDCLRALRADNSDDSNYINNYNDITVSASDATYYVKPKLLGLMSGVFVNVDATGKTEC